MPPDPFASGLFSSVLAWLFCIPVILSLVAGALGMLFEKTDDQIPRWFIVWIVLCVVALSPFRYLALLTLIGTAYSVQSFGAFISVFPLAIYIPIVFGVLCGVGVVLPLLFTLRMAFHNLKDPVVSQARLVLGSIVAPANMLGGYFLFFWLLTYAGKTVHWLRAEDVIGATNGPALFVYQHALKYAMPLPVVGYYQDVTASDRDMLRNHVASFYLGERAEARYVKLSYPTLYEKLTKKEE
jgi:hypothetical protein